MAQQIDFHFNFSLHYPPWRVEIMILIYIIT